MLYKLYITKSFLICLRWRTCFSCNWNISFISLCKSDCISAHPSSSL